MSKILRFFFQTRSNSGNSLDINIRINDKDYTFTVESTEEWCISDDLTGALHVDCEIETPTHGESPPSAKITLHSNNGDIMLVGACENYCWINGSSTGDNFSDSWQTMDIINQPTINGVANLTRYDIAGHYAGGNGGGEFGPGNFLLHQDEIGEFLLEHHFYVSM